MKMLRKKREKKEEVKIKKFLETVTRRQIFGLAKTTHV